jgi:hypothetical protein
VLLRRQNLPYIAVFLVLFAFLGWIIAKMSEQTMGRTLLYMLVAIVLFTGVFALSARFFLTKDREVCPDCEEDVDASQGKCPNCGHEFAGSQT